MATLFVSNLNQTYDPLIAGGVFDGEAELTSGYEGIQVTVNCDQNTTIEMQYSDSTFTWVTIGSDTVLAGVQYSKVFYNLNDYFRIQLTNISGTDQTYMFANCLSYLQGQYVQRELWTSTLVNTGDISNAFTIPVGTTNISVLGNVDNACTLAIFANMTGSSYYQTIYESVIAGAGDFNIQVPFLCASNMYIKAISAAAVTITAYAVAK